MLLDVAKLTIAVYIPFTYLVFLCKGELRLELMAEHSGGARLSTLSIAVFYHCISRRISNGHSKLYRAVFFLDIKLINSSHIATKGHVIAHFNINNYRILVAISVYQPNI